MCGKGGVVRVVWGQRPSRRSEPFGAFRSVRRGVLNRSERSGASVAVFSTVRSAPERPSRRSQPFGALRNVHRGVLSCSERSGASVAVFGAVLSAPERPSRRSEAFGAIWSVHRGVLSRSERSGASIAVFGAVLSAPNTTSAPNLAPRHHIRTKSHASGRLQSRKVRRQEARPHVFPITRIIRIKREKYADRKPGRTFFRSRVPSASNPKNSAATFCVFADR